MFPEITIASTKNLRKNRIRKGRKEVTTNKILDATKPDETQQSTLIDTKQHTKCYRNGLRPQIPQIV